MSLLEKVLKNSTVKLTSTILDSKVFNKKDLAPTPIPALNIALSGRLDGGLGAGLTLFCGKSKHFKTLFTLICAKAYMDKHKDAILLFYDSEFGTPISYFTSLKFDMSRVVHTPITNIEELKFDVMAQLDGINRGDHVFIAVDSVGNLASKKEVEDARDQKSVADMTRAKALKSLFRIVTPHLTIKDIPMVCVNHIYMTQEMFSKAVVSGGDGIYLSADNIFIIGRQQEKDKEGLAGWNFIINVEKSRHTVEKSKIPVTVLYEGGLNKWSGLLEMAEEGGFVAKHASKPIKYSRVDMETGEIEEKKFKVDETSNKDFWMPILQTEKFRDYITKNYMVSNDELITEEMPELTEDE